MHCNIIDPAIAVTNNPRFETFENSSFLLYAQSTVTAKKNTKDTSCKEAIVKQFMILRYLLQIFAELT